jgi:hypothetical protein
MDGESVDGKFEAPSLHLSATGTTQISPRQTHFSQLSAARSLFQGMRQRSIARRQQRDREL